MAIIPLFPAARAELAQQPSGFLSAFFAGDFPTRRTDRPASELAARVVAGGYPSALERVQLRRPAAWYRDYLDAIVQRDVRDLARISGLDALPRLLTLMAGQTARLLNVSDLAAPLSVSRPTIRESVTLPERVLLVEEQPPWHTNRLSRLVKTPTVHMGDTGLACALLGVDTASLASDRALLGQLVYHFEVDLVIERGARQLAGVEVRQPPRCARVASAGSAN